MKIPWGTLKRVGLGVITIGVSEGFRYYQGKKSTSVIGKPVDTPVQNGGILYGSYTDGNNGNLVVTLNEPYRFKTKRDDKFHTVLRSFSEERVALQGFVKEGNKLEIPRSYMIGYVRRQLSKSKKRIPSGTREGDDDLGAVLMSDPNAVDLEGLSDADFKMPDEDSRDDSSIGLKDE